MPKARLELESWANSDGTGAQIAVLPFLFLYLSPPSWCISFGWLCWDLQIWFGWEQDDDD
jgi:hypothetical protein